MHPSDQALMARVQSGDKAAFAQLYDRHSAMAFRVARAICHDTGRAEEAMQEGFLTIWRNRSKYQSERAPFKPWAMRIVQNRAIDSYRRKARSREQPGALHDEMTDETAASPADIAIAKNERQMILNALRQLPDEQAVVITLAYYGGLSQTEIADELHLAHGTVKGRMRLGLEKMRGRIAV